MCSEKHLQELSDKAYRYALLVVKNRDDALDVMQETMYRYIVKNPEFADEKAESAWIYKVASNLSRNVLMNSWYRKRTDIPDDAWEKIFRKDGTESEREWEDNGILKAVHHLPKKYSDVIYFYYYEGYSADESCAVLGIRAGTFYTRLARARRMLRSKLDQSDIEK